MPNRNSKVCPTSSHVCDFNVDGGFYRQTDGVAKGLTLGPRLANAFLVYNKKNG